MTHLWIRMTWAITSVIFIAGLGPVVLALLFIVVRATMNAPLSGVGSPLEYIDSSWVPAFDDGVNYVTSELFDDTSDAITSAIILTVVMGVSAGIWVGRYFARPITVLANAAVRVGSGDFDQQIELTDPSREVQVLANEFNMMSSRLQHSEQQRQQLMADISHELRTPLTVLESQLRAVIDEVNTPDEDTIVGLYAQTTHLIGLVEDLHLLARSTQELELERTAVDVGSLIAEVVWNFEQQANEQSITLQSQTEGSLTLMADSGRLRQILGNLIANALRHTSADGHVTVHAASVGPDIVITVTDDGDGLTVDELELVFDRSWRGPAGQMRDTGGSGLGLAIVRSLVEAHGGSVTAESEGQNSGSTFRIQLPTAKLVA